MTFATLPKSIFGDLDEILLNEQPRPKRVFEQVSESPATTTEKIEFNSPADYDREVRFLMDRYTLRREVAVDIVACLGLEQIGNLLDDILGGKR
jgi:hypothetical protein